MIVTIGPLVVTVKKAPAAKIELEKLVTTSKERIENIFFITVFRFIYIITLTERAWA